MQVEAPATPTTTTKKEKGKKSADGFFSVGGQGRCALCVKDNAECLINMEKIEAWRRLVEQGKKGNRQGTACLRCSGKRVACALPATADLRAAVQATTSRPKRQASPISSVASSGKRRKVEVLIPVRQTTWKAPVGKTEESDALMRQMVGLMRESVVLLRSIEGIAKGMAAKQEGPREESSAMAARGVEEEVIELDDSSDEEDEEENESGEDEEEVTVKGGKGKEKEK